MPFAAQRNKCQLMIRSMEEQVRQDSPVRLIDAFAGGMDLKTLEINRATPASDGQPAYGARELLKLCICGNRNHVRFPGRLTRLCGVNVEAMRTMHEQQPDFRTIADFRKRNAKQLKRVFKESEGRMFDVIEAGFLIDGRHKTQCVLRAEQVLHEGRRGCIVEEDGRKTRHVHGRAGKGRDGRTGSLSAHSKLPVKTAGIPRGA